MALVPHTGHSIREVRLTTQVRPSTCVNVQTKVQANLHHVADDSSLRQAIDVETKRNAGLSRSATKPDAETSHTPTTQDNSGAFLQLLYLYSR
jgi:hypothetical protein